MAQGSERLCDELYKLLVISVCDLARSIPAPNKKEMSTINKDFTTW